jgi:hypothetical protein
MHQAGQVHFFHTLTNKVVTLFVIGLSFLKEFEGVPPDTSVGRVPCIQNDSVGCGMVDCCDVIDRNLFEFGLRTPKIIKTLPLYHELWNVMVI